MPRLSNKGFVSRAPQTGASVPELPDIDARLAELPGGQETNAALQRWWDIVRQRIEFNNGDVTQRFSRIDASFNNGLQTLQAEITNEEIVRANADSALALSIDTVQANVNGLTATVTTLAAALVTATNYLEARWTVNVAAGPIVTGMTLFSASGPDTNVSYISFQADRFLVNTAAGNKQIFAASASSVQLGNVLTVDLANAKVYVGTGTYANANTYFYIDTVSGGRMSLGSKFVWDGSALTIVGSVTASSGTIGGWAISSTTLSNSNAILDSAGQLVLGTSNDIVYLSASDSTYRLWVGNVTAGSAAFSVTKAGVLSATGAIISGEFYAGSGATQTSITSTSLKYGNATDYVQFLVSAGYAQIALVQNGFSAAYFQSTVLGPKLYMPYVGGVSVSIEDAVLYFNGSAGPAGSIYRDYDGSKYVVIIGPNINTPGDVAAATFNGFGITGGTTTKLLSVGGYTAGALGVSTNYLQVKDANGVAINILCQ